MVKISAKRVKEMINCKFSDVSERDMDLLFLEEFVVSQNFADIFLSKINLQGAVVVSVEQSKTDLQLGESDMTVIVEKDNKRYGILIEDKIAAVAMPNQCGRYIERGDKGKENGDYDEYFVFIVAPEKYLMENIEAKKYPNKVKYEECLAYFSSGTENRFVFKLQQIEQAINKPKHGYQVIGNVAVTSFWRKYIAYQKERYPNFFFKDNIQAKGSNATWVCFHTCDPKIKIFHKSSEGFVDLEFAGLGCKTARLKDTLSETEGKLWEKGLSVWKTGKSAVIRIKVPEIDFKTDFESAVLSVNEALAAVDKLYSVLDNIPARKIEELFAL